MRYGRTLDPEMAAAIARMKAIAAGLPDRYALPFPQARAQLLHERRWWLEDAPAMQSTTETLCAVSGRRVGLRLHRPHAAPAPAVVVYLHGGGWCVGSNDTHDGVLRHLAAASGLDVVGVDYSLAPEHPFPAAADDVAAVADGIAQERPFVLAGDSAGAHLALVEAMRRRDAGLRQAAGLVLFYGTYGPLREDGSAAAYGSGEFGLSVDVMRRYLAAFLGNGTTRDPRAHPLLGDFAGLPPAHLAAAQLDPLLDETIAAAHRLAAAGNRVSMDIHDGVIHGFISYTRMVGKARDALARAGRFAADRVR
jgi:acetyl esterase